MPVDAHTMLVVPILEVSLQALQVLETLIIKDSDKLDIRDKQAVSHYHRNSDSNNCSHAFAPAIPQAHALQEERP